MAGRAQTLPRAAMSADPSEDDLAQHWSLTPADVAEIIQCRGADHRCRFALQLCMLRTMADFSMTTATRQSKLSIISRGSLGWRLCCSLTAPAGSRRNASRHSVSAAILVFAGLTNTWGSLSIRTSALPGPLLNRVEILSRNVLNLALISSSVAPAGEVSNTRRNSCHSRR